MDSTASAAIFGDDLSLLIQHGWSDGIPPRPAYDYSMAIIQQLLQLYTDALSGYRSAGVQGYPGNSENVCNAAWANREKTDNFATVKGKSRLMKHCSSRGKGGRGES